MEPKEILITSTMDGTLQPSLFYPARGKNRPLLVGLHTWSTNRYNQIDNMLPFALENDFNLLLPEFRGPNILENPSHTLACGSAYAKQDIKDAVDYVIQTESIDTENIFLLGLSGGGHMALLMAGFCPSYFKAIGAFVPIVDLKKWAEQSADYRDRILGCCSHSDEELLLRSPMHYIDTIAQANLKIFHGKYDSLVPVTHSIELYQRLFERYPSARVFLDIFDGGHEMDMHSAGYWILSNYSGTGKVAVTG